MWERKGEAKGGRNEWGDERKEGRGITRIGVRR